MTSLEEMGLKSKMERNLKRTGCTVERDLDRQREGRGVREREEEDRVTESKRLKHREGRWKREIKRKKKRKREKVHVGGLMCGRFLWRREHNSYIRST